MSMIKRTLSFALVTALTVLAPTALRADEWLLFKAPGNEFQVKLPGEPATQKMETPTPAGKMKMTMYIANDSDTNAIVGVVSCALPPAIAAQFKENPEIGLDGLVEGMIAGVNGKKTSIKPVKMGTYSGREFEANIYDGEGKLFGRAFVIDDKAYMLMVMAPKDQDSKGEARKFFGSFKVNPSDN
jgi:hypothetical protein